MRQYIYNIVKRMAMGKNLETGEETIYVPDYLSITNNDLMACEKDAGAACTVFGQGHERLVWKAASRKIYFQPDLYGSILSVSDGQGQNLGYSEWDVWGNVEFHGQGNQPRPEGGAVPGFTSYIPDPVIGKHFAQARFYDPAHGRMLAPDPVKRGLNGYPYCGNDPVNYVDPTGEVANILAGGILGGIMGGIFGFAGSAISQIAGGQGFSVREAAGAAANGAVVGAVRGALIGSGAGLPVVLVSDFTAGKVGSTLEQLITGGKADAGKSIAGGLTNAVSGAIYGNNPLGSLKEAFIKGAKAGAATSGISYLSEVFGGQDEERRSGTLRGSLGLVPFGRVNDPRRGCMARDPFGGMTEEVSDYGYQYQMPRSERTVRKAPERFSLAEFGREVVTGFVMGGLASAAFYGAGRAVEAVKSSVRSVYEGGSAAAYKYNMVENPGPLADMPNNPASNFASGKYNMNTLPADTTFYRAGESGTPYGQWFTSAPANSAIQVRMDTAVKPQWVNSSTGVLEGHSYVNTNYAINIPKGTTVYTGPVGYQGGAYLGGEDILQTFIPEPWDIPGVKVISSKPLH